MLCSKENTGVAMTTLLPRDREQIVMNPFLCHQAFGIILSSVRTLVSPAVPSCRCGNLLRHKLNVTLYILKSCLPVSDWKSIISAMERHFVRQPNKKQWVTIRQQFLRPKGRVA